MAADTALLELLGQNDRSLQSGGMMKMRKLIVGVASALSAVALCGAAQAALIVTQVGNGTAAYQGTPTIVGYTAAAATVGQGITVGNTPGSGNTFTAPAEGGTLAEVQFKLVGSGNYTLHLYPVLSDVNTVAGMTLGPDLVGLSADVSAASGNVISFALTDADQEILSGGAGYLASLTLNSLAAGNTQAFYFRGGGDVYAGGTGIYNGGQASSGVNRDSAFAVTIAPVPEPTSLGMAGVAAMGLLARRRRRRQGLI